MASPSIKRGKQQVSGKPISLAMVSLFPRRCAAWVLEVYLVALSGLIPYSIGVYIESHSETQLVPLSPTLTRLDDGINKILSLKREQVLRQVPPLTNFFWELAVVAPLVVTGWQFLLLAKNGRTLPKRWLGVRVVTDTGKSPGLLRVFLREVVGKGGLPMGVAYFIWRYTWIFPNVSMFIGLSGLLFVLQAGMALSGSRRKAFHDELAGTIVIDTRKGLRNSNSRKRPSAVPVEVQMSVISPPRANYQEAEPVKAIVLSPTREKPRSNLWLWMRQHPGTTLLVFALAGMTAIMGTFVATQIYIQFKADQRQTQQEKSAAFLDLAKQLAATSTDPLQERKSLILALARLDDPRAIPLLTDLLAQETNPSLIETIQQALASAGTRSLPELRKLNHSLSNQLQSLGQFSSQEQALISLRLKATKQAIATLFIQNNGNLMYANLSKADLSRVQGKNEFTLILQEMNLSGINFRSAKLAQANFRGSSFASAGKDKHFDTYDDLITDFSGASLTNTDFTGAFLSRVNLVGANLIQSNLKKADLSRGKLTGANLSASQLSDANLQQANLEKSSLTGAFLTGANLTKANLQWANLGQVQARGTDFSLGNLSQANGQGADFSGSNFTGANLQQIDLSSTLLKGANFNNAQLQNANLAYANLSQADLRGANLDGANFTGATLAVSKTKRINEFLKDSPKNDSVAQIQGVDFNQVKNLSPAQIELICQNGGIHRQCQ